MKKILVSSFLFLAINLFAQKDECQIQVKISQTEFTEAKFRLELDNETIKSINGILTIPKDKFDKNKDVDVILKLEDEIVFRKVYIVPKIFTSKNKLKDLCGIYIIKEK
jgi:hypothetical protein